MIEVSAKANEKVLEYVKANNSISTIRVFLNAGG